MSIETLDYTVIFNGHTVTCFEVGSVPTIGYASIEDAMTGTNPVTVPESVFDATCALLNQGVHLTAIYAHVGEETWMQWDETPEELTAEDIVSIEGEKLTMSAKQRRSARRVQNARHKQSDRLHGKRHGDKYLDSLPRKKYLEADNYDHPTFKVEKGKLRPIHDVKRARETARFHDAMDVSEIERLTASVLAEVKQYHGMVGCTWNVFYLSEAICRREQLPYPDSVCVREQGDSVQMILEYFDSYDEYPTPKYINLR